MERSLPSSGRCAPRSCERLPTRGTSGSVRQGVAGPVAIPPVLSSHLCGHLALLSCPGEFSFRSSYSLSVSCVVLLCLSVLFSLYSFSLYILRSLDELGYFIIYLVKYFI